MRTLFVGDVHNCPRALEKLLAESRPDRLILLGDMFNKGPDPRRLWDMIVDLKPEAVLGNHDDKVLGVWGKTGDGSAFWTAAQLPEDARGWLMSLPLFLHGPDWVAVHAGLHPEEGVAGTNRKMALVLRRWPDDRDPQSPFWWQLYAGTNRVFYGHDAVRGLQVHPRTIGLDTGCVYGYLLSGYLLEEDRVYQVPGGA